MSRIETLLIANRGEIARRIVRTCRAMGIRSVAVYSDADRDEAFVTDADVAVPIGGAAPADSYLRADKLIDAATRTGADAVHPGYGFLSENAAFASACAAAGLGFVGPPPDAIAAMGSKLVAKDLMRAAGVPTLPSLDLGDRDTPEGADGVDGVGWPMLVKAAFGGGGRGMRVVRTAPELADAIASARREAAAAFGDGAVFLERYLDSARHIEVQVFADDHGNAIHLFERECSVQRRHQKVIEEAPSPAVDPALRARLGAAAVAAATAIGYRGAGTVEFLLAATGEFFFLEMNTRLQVEHPVTEAITGLDLVRLQLLVAQGEPLPADALGASIHGHAIEARLYAEDPARDYLPATGTIARFRTPDLPGLRVDAVVDTTVESATGAVAGVRTAVGVHYDPMLAKVIAHAPTRAEAAALLAGALDRTQVHGVTTNQALLAAILRHPEFRAGGADTGFLERHPPAELLTPPDAAAHDGRLRLHIVAAVLALHARHRTEAPLLGSLPGGWRNNRSQLEHLTVELTGPTGEPVPHDVGYQVVPAVVVEIDGVAVTGLTVLRAEPELVDVVLDGVRHRCTAHHVDDRIYVDGAGPGTTVRLLPRFSLPESELEHGSLVAPMPGTVVRTPVAAGDHVEAGEVLVVVEAMKMEHIVVAPHAGVVASIPVTVGQVIDVGTVLAVLADDVSREGFGEGFGEGSVEEPSP